MVRGRLHLRPIRVANCVPIGSSRAVASVGCSFWNVDLPSVRVFSGRVGGDGVGGADFLDADLWLPVGDASLGVVVRAELTIAMEDSETVRKAGASVTLDFARPSPPRLRDGSTSSSSQLPAYSSAQRPPSDAGSVWCQLRDTGPAGGAVCGELLLRWERCVNPFTPGRRRPPHPPTFSLFGPLPRISEESPARKRSNSDRSVASSADGQQNLLSSTQAGQQRNFPPIRGPQARQLDLQGFELRVPALDYDEFREYYWLRCESQLQAWAAEMSRARALGLRVGDAWVHTLRAREARLGDSIALGNPATLRPGALVTPSALWLTLSGAAEMRRDTVALEGVPALWLDSVALGIPAALRPALWLTLSGAAEMRRCAGVHGSYQALASAEPAPVDPAPHSRSNRLSQRISVWLHQFGILRRSDYRQPVSNKKAHPFGPLPKAEAVRQIDLDLSRTFPDHAEFKSAHGRATLRRVLCAHCVRNPAAGYTQSLNFLAAFFLLQLPDVVEGGASRGTVNGGAVNGGAVNGGAVNAGAMNGGAVIGRGASRSAVNGASGGVNGGAVVERGASREEAAFWLLEAATERLLPGYFTAQLAGVQVDTRVLDELVASHPRLCALQPALQELGLELSLVSTQWLMLGFVSALPTETTLRTWDLFLALGPRVLLAAALALLHLLRDAILACSSFESAYTVLKEVHRPTLDCDRFIRLLLRELDDLPASRLCALRESHLRAVLREQQERDMARHGRTHRKAGIPRGAWRRRVRTRLRLAISARASVRRLAAAAAAVALVVGIYLSGGILCFDGSSLGG
jgi:hypothetical protein